MDIKKLMHKAAILFCVNIRWAVPQFGAFRETWLVVSECLSDEIFWGTSEVSNNG